MTLSYTSVCSYHSAALAGGELSGARAVSTAADHNLWLSVFLHEVQLLAAAPRAAVARAGLALACWLSSRWSACWPSHFQPSAGSARWQRKPHHSAFLPSLHPCSFFFFSFALAMRSLSSSLLPPLRVFLCTLPPFFPSHSLLIAIGMGDRTPYGSAGQRAPSRALTGSDLRQRSPCRHVPSFSLTQSG